MKIIKKSLSLLVSAVAVLLLSGFINLQPVTYGPKAVYAYESNICSIISGGTDPVLSPETAGRVAGIADSGSMNFGARWNTPQYQACVKSEIIDAGETTANLVQGWAWNTNLGDISFSCSEGQNAGVACGDWAYRTVVFEDGSVWGFAYGDNIGYISMGCDSEGMNLGYRCDNEDGGVIEYGVQIAGEGDTGDDSCPNLAPGDLYGYAWADSVGWINFCGAHVDIIRGAPIEAEISYPSEGDPSNIDDYEAGSDRTAEHIYANGIDKHEISVYFKDTTTGLPINMDTEGLRVEIDPEFSGKVCADQVISPANQAGGHCVDAVSKPTGEDFRYNTANNTYSAPITSVAPTDEDQNKIILTKLDIRIYDETHLIKAIEQNVNESFVFKAPIAVTNISTDIAGEFEQDTLSLNANTPQELRIWAKRYTSAGVPPNSQINIASQIYNCSPSSNGYTFELRSSLIATDSTEPPPADYRSTNAGEQVCNGSGTIQAVDTANLYQFTEYSENVIEGMILRYITAATSRTSNVVEQTDALGVHTIVSYTMDDKSVRYFSHPASNGSVKFQAAMVQGDVGSYVRHISELDLDRVRRSLGENAQSKREIFYREIKKVIGKQTPQSFETGGVSKTIDQTFLNDLTTKNIIYFKCPTSDQRSCNIILKDDDGMLEVEGNKTIVAIGANVFIDSNIKAATAGSRLAIIALEDLGKNYSQKGGNAYLCGNVTDVELNAVFDNSLFSYGGTANDTNCVPDAAGASKMSLINPDGIPIVPELSYDATFKNQLAWTGTLTSNNTYGGASQNPPILGNGKKAGTEDEIRQAIWYDINFLRRAHVVGRFANGIDDEEGTLQCWQNGITLSKTISGNDYGGPSTNETISPTCSQNNAESSGIVNFFYSPVPQSQPIFNVELKK